MAAPAGPPVVEVRPMRARDVPEVAALLKQPSHESAAKLAESLKEKDVSLRILSMSRGPALGPYRSMGPSRLAATIARATLLERRSSP